MNLFLREIDHRERRGRGEREKRIVLQISSSKQSKIFTVNNNKPKIYLGLNQGINVTFIYTFVYDFE